MIKLPRRAVIAAALASTALVPLTFTAIAQTQGIVLDEITVEADGGDDTTGVKNQTSGTKTATPVAEVPQSISVVTRAELDKVASVKADEALRYTAGVSTTTYGTDADTDWYFIRGFQAEQTGMFMDGLSLYQYSFGTFLVDPFLLDRIEVLKGPSSGLYGGSNVGGLVNYVSKRPTGEPLAYTETGINSHGNAYVGFDVGDGTDAGDLAYRVTGKVSGGGWETEDAQDLRGNILGSVKWSPTADTSLTLYGSYQNVDLDHTSTGFLPYVGTVVPTTDGYRIPRDLNYGEPAIDVYEREQLMLGYEFEHKFNDSWTLRQNGRYAAVDLYEDYVYASGFANIENGTELVRDRWTHDTQAGLFTVDTQVEGKFATGAIDHTLLLGVDYKNFRHEAATAYTGDIGNLDIFNPVYGIPYTAPSFYPTTTTNMQQTGFYVQDQLELDSWILTLNGRYDLAKSEIVGGATREDSVFTGRAGLGHEFDNGVTPYVSYSTSFLPSLSPTFGGGLLPAETGEQWEAGIKWEPDFMDGVITASVFDITRDNVAADDPDHLYNYVPLGTVNVKGAEIEALVKFDNFGVRGALTWLEAEVVNSTNSAIIGNSPVQIPALTASLGVEYSFDDGALNGLTIGAGMRYLGESWADIDNTAKVSDATLFDAGLSYKQDDWGLSLNVSNLFDTEYVASCRSLTSCGYGAGRTVSLSFNKTW